MKHRSTPESTPAPLPSDFLIRRGQELLERGDVDSALEVLVSARQDFWRGELPETTAEYAGFYERPAEIEQGLVEVLTARIAQDHGPAKLLDRAQLRHRRVLAGRYRDVAAASRDVLDARRGSR